ncbi:alkaline phosphatase D family protein [Parachitinimonas caeni]|nr:alkaline phosphatase D family protein [Parachitinimonas caeni]
MMDRRQFLKWGGFVTVTAATGNLMGCSSSDSSSTSTIPGTDITAPATPAATGSGWKFPQSIASGDPRPDSILLWTRVVPASADDVLTASTDTNVSIRLIVSDADHSSKLGSNSAIDGNLVVDTTVPAYAMYDNTVRSKITNLAAGKVYFYQFIAGDVRSRVGRFKTAPAKDADVSQLKFAFMTCQDWSINHWGAFSHLVANEKDLDFFVHLGDYIYETVGEAFQKGAVEAAHGPLSLPQGAFKPNSNVRYADALVDYRYLYKKYRSDTRLQAVHERYAVIAIWDDHEFSDDAWRDTHTYDNGTFNATVGGDNTHQPQRRRNANRAWYEYMPADIWFSAGETYGVENIKIYRELQFGKLMHLIMTDERLYRADHMIPEAATNPATGQAIGAIGARYMAPETTLYGAEQQKIALTTRIGTSDPLLLVSMLGQSQRQWWMDTMKSSPATWKIWGNEVSLLRMGINGTDAIATLIALGSISTLATGIGNAAASTGHVPTAAALVAGTTAGVPQANAAAVAKALATAYAAGANSVQTLVAATASSGLPTSVLGLMAQTFLAAMQVAAGDSTAQATAGAQVIAFGYIKADIMANQAKSTFITNSGKAAALTPFFQKFLLNADQWDGYNAERKALMAHLKDNGIKNVVAITGDIHSFFAGTVNDDYQASNGGTPVMVDLVTAGISSDSFFTYLQEAVGALSADLATLVYYPLTIPVTGLGTIKLNVDLLDYSLGRAAPNAAALGEQIRVQLRGALAAAGLPEAQLDATVAAVLAGLTSSSSFGSLVGLAQQLASLNSNPWLKYVETDAQGYSVITLTPGNLSCQFRRVNKLVGTNAPANVVASVKTATVTRDVVDVKIS